MGLGIIEPKGGRHVPGTVQLFDNNNPVDVAGNAHLKHGEGQDSELLFVPQPSKSPNDPLNWPLWKRDLTLVIICMAGAVAGILGPAISAINGVLVDEFGVSYRTVATWSGWQFWSAGVAGVFASSVGRIWGKRPVYLVSIVLVLIGAIWNAATRTSTGFLVSRTIEGFGMGAFESIVPSTIGDLFYVHERGKRVAFYNFSFLGSVYFMPILAGYISMKKGWRTQFIIISALLGAILVLAFFLLPEHVYNRPAVYDTDTHSTDRVQELAETPEKNEPVTREGEGRPESLESANVETRRTWVQDLKLYNGRFSDEPFWKCFLVPFVLMAYPATWWAFLLQGTFVTWGIGVAIILAQLFAGPPTNFGPDNVGFMYTAPFLGAIIAYAMAGPLSDRSARWMARRNHNIYEPEFRILLVIPTTLVAIPGMFAFGYVSQQAKALELHWIVPSFCFGLLTFGVVMSCTATFSYILDAHRDVALEMMVGLLVLKNFWAWGSTYFISDWLTAEGPKNMFFAIGGIQLAICLLSIVMYMFGKVQRDWYARNNPLKKLGLYPKKIIDIGGH